MYNNSFRVSIGMPPYEVLYGRKYKSSLYWDDFVKRKTLGFDTVKEMIEIVKKIKQKI